MSYAGKIVKKGSSGYPQLIQNSVISRRYPQIWIIGNLDILDKKLLGLFCSVKCPGNVILKTYDLARKLRDAGIAVVSGFHSPIEKDCLDLLLKGTQPIAICPARSIENMRIPKAWQKSLAENRLLILSPFEPKHRRPTATLAEQRNKFVASLANKIFVAHASEASLTERFCNEIITLGKQINTFNFKENYRLSQSGVVKVSTSALINGNLDFILEDNYE
ncbi:MAG: DNA-processing protein DprA [Desulfobacterales bacterium]|jgi:predicted Rossmann fold nucleotide-binding protein DprA/Smf involved in DNA uptake